MVNVVKSSSPILSNPLAKALLLSLIIWAVYLAVGSTGYFVQPTLFDIRKSLIVLTCMALFLGLWLYVFNQNQARLDARHSVPGQSYLSTSGTVSWSRPGLLSLGLVGSALATWAAAVVSFGSASRTLTTCLGWLTALLVTLAGTSGMVALSERRIRRGKWLGLVGLVSVFGALVGFVVRMTRG